MSSCWYLLFVMCYVTNFLCSWLFRDVISHHSSLMCFSLHACGCAYASKCVCVCVHAFYVSVFAVSSRRVAPTVRPSLLQRHFSHYWQSVPHCVCLCVDIPVCVCGIDDVFADCSSPRESNEIWMSSFTRSLTAKWKQKSDDTVQFRNLIGHSVK